MSKKSVAVRLTAVAALVASSGLGAASSADAAMDCSQYGANKDPGYLYTNGSVAYHRGPAAQCAVVSHRSGKAQIQCSKYNSSGNLWYFVRDSSSNTVGWVWSGNVRSVSGSNHAKC